MSPSSSSSSKKKNRSSVFDAIQELDSQDVRASRKRKSSSQDARKSKAARSQTKIHGHLMECRILLQRAMTTALEETDAESVEQQCNQVLSQLLHARAKLTNRQDDTIDYKEIVNSQDLPNVLQEEYEECRKDWKQVLDRRHKDLRLHSGLSNKTKFRVMDSSFWQQVDATVSHEQLRAQSSHTNNNDDVPVFDDSKVYQHMLQDFVVSSSIVGGAEEAAALRLKKAQKASDASKLKQQVDRRASKGRKIRYVEIPKLVNFTFPVARPTVLSSGMDDDEFFKSLFGGATANKR